jgi:MinD-like ATPase involved in chromosome partitioning or flagellar assembly
MDAAPRPLGRIITFYSYKGGTGRSMALANIAWMLASAGRRVLTIDWDLEAPGLHRYFRPFLIDEELTATDGLMDLVDAYANAAIRPAGDGAADPDWFLPYTDFSDYIVSVNFPHFRPGGKIDFLPAGRQGDRYAVGVSSFNWQNFYDRLGGGGFFEAVKQRARAQYDYVLIDSRTGVSDTAGICSVQMPDTLVVCFTYNNQSIKGAAATARSARDTHRRHAEEKLALHRSSAGSSSLSLVDTASRPFRIFPVPMRVDSGESDRLAVRQRFAQNLFADLIEHIDAADVVGEYWRPVEVPYAVFYAYEEVLAPFKDDPQDPKTVLASLLRLTRYVTDGDVSSYQLLASPEQRQGYLEAFATVTSGLTTPKVPTPAQQETAEQKLARSAETAVALLSEADRATATRILLRLVRVGREEDGGVHAAILVPLSDFTEAEKEIIKHLVAHGVVTVTTDVRPSPSSRSAEPTVCLADARLLTAWRTLVDWIEGDREFMLWRQQLRAYMADWERSGRDRGALLSGRLLGEADLMSVRRRDDLTAAEALYIEESRTARETVHYADEVRSAAARGVQEARSISAGAMRGNFPLLRLAALALLAIGATAVAIVMWGGLGSAAPAVVPEDGITVPRLIGLSTTEAKTTAEAIGLQVVMTDGTSPDAPLLEGVVEDQTPRDNEKIEAGGVVRLRVAALPATVPTLTGLNLTMANSKLDEQRLRLGETQLRYVADATVDTVIGQNPPPGTKIPAGSAVSVDVARAARLTDFRIGIYYVDTDPVSKALADRLRTLLRKAGGDAMPSARPAEFFSGRRQPARNEIRYSSEAELQAANELQRLMEKGGDFPALAPRPVRNSSEEFISVFLLPEGDLRQPQQQQLQKK